MYKHLFTVPISKVEFLTSKIIIIMIGLLFLTLVSFGGGVILSCISGYLNISLTNIVKCLILYIKSFLAFIPLMIPIIFLTLIFRGFIVPIAFSILVELIFIILFQTKYIALNPWSAPVLVGTSFLEQSNEHILGNSFYTIGLAASTGIIFFIISNLYLLNKNEI